MSGSVMTWQGCTEAIGIMSGDQFRTGIAHL